MFHVKHFRRRRATRRAFAFVFALSATFGATQAHAEPPAPPQLTTGLTIGGGIADIGDSAARRAAFHLGAWADILFLRQRDSQVALGPYMQVATTAFQTLDLSLGPSFLIPLGGPVLQLSVGPNLRVASGGPYAGVLSKAFFGARSLNFHSAYSMTVGGFVESRASFGMPGGTQTDLIVGLQLDSEVLALPFIFAFEAIRGPRDRR